MAIFHGNSISSVSSGDSTYTIDNSCRFNDDDSPYLVRTPGSTGDRRTWTVSCWVKRNNLGMTFDSIFGSAGTGNATQIGFNGDALRWYEGGGDLVTNAKYRDVGNWYHIVARFDSTQSSATQRQRLYVNGEEITSFSTDTAVSQNHDSGINNTEVFQVGQVWDTGGSTPYYSDSYISEFHFIDGTALGADSFGETGDYGEWKPIQYTDSHGTNGFYLDFADSSDLGNDASANSNNFTVTNITASDQVTDTPTNNFATWNNLDDYYWGGTYTEGNTKVTTQSGSGKEPCHTATMGVSSGKWYFEVYVQAHGGDALVGIAGRLGEAANDQLGQYADQYGFYSASGYGNLVTNNGYSSYGTLVGYTAGDIISVAMDLDNSKLYFAKNNSWLNSGNPAGNSNGYSITAATNTTTGSYFPACGDYASSANGFILNAGQDGTFAGNVTAGGYADNNSIGNFKYAPPAGFLSLCTANLAEPTVIPSEHFNTLVLTGNSSTNRNVTGVGFQPDLVWGKQRASVGRAHGLFDSVRGGGYRLASDSTAAESYNATDFIKSFTVDGFTVGQDESFNQSGSTYAFWNWKAGGAPTADNSAGAGATPTAGSVKIDGVNLGSALAGTLPATGMSVNTTAGFSITKYAGTGNEVKTVAHGLSITPNLVIIKRREDSAHGWSVGTIQPLGSRDFTDTLFLHDTSTGQDDAVWWNDTAPSSTVVTIGSNSWVNNASKNFIMYCFHSVEGFSKIGTYKGNANTDGSFVYTGFAPTWLLIKRLDGTYGWAMHDNKRDTTNPITAAFKADDTETETTISNGGGVDFLSNGFKIKDSGTGMNASGGVYLYYAIAEQPFKHSNAR